MWKPYLLRGLPCLPTTSTLLAPPCHTKCVGTKAGLPSRSMDAWAGACCAVLLLGACSWSTALAHKRCCCPCHRYCCWWGTGDLRAAWPLLKLPARLWEGRAPGSCGAAEAPWLALSKQVVLLHTLPRWWGPNSILLCTVVTNCAGARGFWRKPLLSDSLILYQTCFPLNKYGRMC